MNIKFLTGALLAFLLLTTTSCKKDEVEKDGKDEFTTADLNEWIYEGMQSVYLWNDKIPTNLNPLTEEDPIEFFEKMVYRDIDRWSWITDDWAAFQAELQGVPLALGISPAFGHIVATDNIVIVVEFVYPGSPADEAGLKRGDIIVRIDNQEMTPENYYTLFSQATLVIELGDADANGIYGSGKTISLNKEIIETDPIIYHGILNVNGKKTGYLVFSEFISGIDNKFRNELGLLFDDFAAEGVTELIVDLRYNPGGEINMAAFLASAIAPASAINSREVLVSYVYNQGLHNYFKNEYGENSDELSLKFQPNEHNLDLDRVFFLTTSGSASASELVIIGLEPYMDVVQIGETTHGKYTGAWVINDTEDPERHNYAMVPIVLKYANANGFTDFADGLEPDYQVDESIQNLREFGDLSDPMLAKVVELLGGTPAVVPKKAAGYPEINRIVNEKEVMRNLFIPRKEIPVLHIEERP